MPSRSCKELSLQDRIGTSSWTHSFGFLVKAPQYGLLNYKSRPCVSSIFEKSNEALIFTPLGVATKSAPFSLGVIDGSPLAAFFGNKKITLSIEPSAPRWIFTSLGVSLCLVRFVSRTALVLRALSSAD